MLYNRPVALVENRKFPRIPHVTSRQILSFDGGNNTKENLVLTQNLSASGIKFTTNGVLESEQCFLICLNDHLMQQIRTLFEEHEDFLRAGDYYLTKVVWVNEVKKNQGIYEVGASFLRKTECGPKDVDTLTELMNAQMLKEL